MVVVDLDADPSRHRRAGRPVLCCRVVVSPSGIQMRRLFWWVDVGWHEIRSARGIDRFPLSSLIQLTSDGDRVTTVRLGGWWRARRVDAAIARAQSASAGAVIPFPVRWAARHRAVAILGLLATAALVGGLAVLRHAQVEQRAIDRGGRDRFRVNPDDIESQLNWARFLLPLALTLAAAALVVYLRQRLSKAHTTPAEPAPAATAPTPQPDGIPAIRPPRFDAAAVPSISVADAAWYHEPWGPAPDVEVALLEASETTLLTYRRGRFRFAGTEPPGLLILDIDEIRLHGRVRFDPSPRAFLRPGSPRRVDYTLILFCTPDGDHALDVPVAVASVHEALAFTGIVVDASDPSTAAPEVRHV